MHANIYVNIFKNIFIPKHLFLYSKHSIKPYKFNLLESPAYCHLTACFYEIQATKELKSGGRIW